MSPIDASLALWGDGRRERLAELEEELRRHDIEQQQQQDEGSSVPASKAPRGGEQAEGDSALGSKPSATLGKEAAPRKQHTGERAPTTQGDAGPASPPRGETADRNASNTTRGSTPRTFGGGRSRAPLSSATILEERLGRWGAGWRPPALRGLPRGGEGFFSGWTHMGQPERFELVKSVNRYVCVDVCAAAAVDART